MLRALLIIVVLLGTRAAEAQDTRVDWELGLLIASGAAVGDLRAPTRALARIKAERRARERAEAKLSTATRELQVAGKGTIAKIPSIDEKLAEASLGTLMLSIDYGSDGSVVVELAMPLDGLRTVLFEPDTPLESPSKGPQAVIVDARSVSLRPAIGVALSDGADVYRGPTLFYSNEKEAKKDSRMRGAKVLAVKEYQGGVLLVPKTDLEALRASGSLIGIIWSEQQ